jgi:hypothetical protein
MIVHRDSAWEIIQRCKVATVRVVARGAIFIIEYNEFQEVDLFVLNEAEETLKPFLRYLKEGRAERVYASDRFPRSPRNTCSALTLGEP